MTKQESEIVFGRHPVLEALKSGRQINKVFIQDGSGAQALKDIHHLAKEKKIQVSFAPKNKLDQLVSGQNHQGVVLTASPVAYASLDDLYQVARNKEEDPFFLILDGIEDPHNLGSILRTADASGVHGIIIPNRRAVGLTATVSKASTGAIEHVPVARVSNINQTIKKLKDDGFWIYGTDVEGEDYRQWNVSGPIALVVGNEGQGISHLVKENVDQMLTIPMTGHVQSLNASVASAILMYEVYRKRKPQ